MLTVIFSGSIGAPRLTLADACADMEQTQWQINAVAKIIGDQYYVADVFNANDSFNCRFTWKRETIVKAST